MIKGIPMSSKWAPYVVAVIAVLICANLSLRIGDLNDEVTRLESDNEKLVTTNKDLAWALEVQNAAVRSLQEQALVEADEAEDRAEPIRSALPKKIAADIAAGTQPQEMNQWLSTLFSPSH